MAAECLKAAEDLYVVSAKKAMADERIAAAAELYTTTGNKKYLDAITSQKGLYSYTYAWYCLGSGNGV